MSELLGQLSPPLVLIVGWLLIVAEAGLLIGVFLPGTSVLVALGYLSHLGVVPLGATIAVAAFAAITGTQLSFLMGRRRTLEERPALGKRPALEQRPALGKRRDA